MIKFLSIPDKERRTICQDVSNKLGLPPQAIEKDVWVTLMLRMVFTSDHAERFVFKGGTSLSKAYKLIQRFSEDIDLGIDRSSLGFEGDLSKGQIRKLRRACHSYVSEELPGVLEKRMSEYGLDPDKYQLIVENTNISDQDPETLVVKFQSLFDEVAYLSNNIKIEVSARSLIEPFQQVSLNSWVDEQYPEAKFVESPFEVNTTLPEKTFLEKLILLHEEFQKPVEKIRYLRMSRHFYDLGQIINTPFGKNALNDTALFDSIIAHRKVLTPIPTTNYDELTLKLLNLVPPNDHMKNYLSDYGEMQDSMIHGESLKFEALLGKITNALK